MLNLRPVSRGSHAFKFCDEFKKQNKKMPLPSNTSISEESSMKSYIKMLVQLFDQSV